MNQNQPPAVHGGRGNESGAPPQGEVSRIIRKRPLFDRWACEIPKAPGDDPKPRAAPVDRETRDWEERARSVLDDAYGDRATEPGNTAAMLLSVLSLAVPGIGAETDPRGLRVEEEAEREYTTAGNAGPDGVPWGELEHGEQWHWFADIIVARLRNALARVHPAPPAVDRASREEMAAALAGAPPVGSDPRKVQARRRTGNNLARRSDDP